MDWFSDALRSVSEKASSLASKQRSTAEGILDDMSASAENLANDVENWFEQLLD
jgi:hypothetical protein